MYDKLTWFFAKYFELKRKWKYMNSDKPKQVLTEEFLRDRLVELICRDMDLRETYGKNRHNVIDNINIRMKLPLGSPYCLSGLLIRGVDDLCKELDLFNPVTMSGSTQNWFNSVPEKYKGYEFEEAQRADIGILQKTNLPSNGHAYILTVKPIFGWSWVHNTAEYNTNKVGSADGEGFYLLSRVEGSLGSMRFRGYVNVIKWIMEKNNL